MSKKIVSKEIAPGKGAVKLDVPDYCTVRLQASSLTGLSVYGIMPDGSESLLGILRPGFDRLALRLQHFEHVAIRAPEAKAEFAYTMTCRELQKGETIDDLPPPAPTQPSNVLARIRNEVRRQMGAQREGFLDFVPEDRLPGYELPDDVEPLFEEEEAAIAAQQAKEAKQKKEQSNAVVEPASESEEDPAGA